MEEGEQADFGVVAAAHDAMADEYDEINDLWYAHLFNRIHDFILREVGRPGTALDVGCGTGFQTFLLARAGFAARGFDIAGRLVARAKEKARGFLGSGREGCPLCRFPLPSFTREQTRLLDRADRLRGNAPVVPPEFALGDATDPSAYEPGGYDVVVACGSVLSFIEESDRAVRLMAAALRPGGLLFLEVEQRANLDLLWPLVDAALAGKLGYDQPVRESLRNLLAPPGTNVRIAYPFRLANGEEVVLPLRLFSVGYLHDLFRRHQLAPRRRVGIHALTNLLPSTLLHDQAPPRALQGVFGVLCRAERAVAGIWPFSRFGCSVLYCCEKLAGA
jgi:SAM-dependent methyltransferase